jgi:NADPH:quinone reductase-like Zn-dependent oxidoreductase
VLVEPVFRSPGAPVSTAAYFGSEVDGAFAEFAVAPSRHTHRIDSPLSDVELASFPCSYSAAENMLTRASVKAGEHVLITGSSGGVGTAAVQLALARGAHVYALAASDKQAALRALGVTEVATLVEHLNVRFERNRFDVVLDVVGGPKWPTLLEALRPGGRYAVCGAIAGQDVTLDLRTLYLKDLSLFGCTVLDGGVFERVVRHIERGAVRPLIGAVFTLEDIVSAQQQFLAKQHVGKIVLTVG